MSDTASVLLREEGSLVEVPINHYESALIEEQVADKWQDILDLIVQIFNVPSALIMRIRDREIEVFEKSSNVDNPYEKNEKTELNLGLYCETAIGRDAMLEVVDSLSLSSWKDNPDVKLNMISYLGYPVKWPDGSFFGTLCVLDTCPREFESSYKELLNQFKYTLEKDLSLLTRTDELKRSLDMQEKYHDRVLELESRNISSRLVAEFAHEINTPLGIAITTATYMESQCRALSEKPGANKLDEALELLNRNLTNAARIVSSYRKAATDGKRGVREVFSLAEYIDSVFLIMKPELKRKDVSFHIEGDRNLKVDSFPGLIVQVLANLINNSIRHGFKKSEAHAITVYFERKDHVVRILYRDNGSGIPAEYAREIFNAYYRLDEKDEGSGLGLSITREIVEKSLGGTITCKGGSSGGAEFLIEIPRGEI